MHPERIGHYTLLDLLGAGGMGEVYRAEDSRLGRTVALKLLPPGLTADEERRQRFLREARLAARLTHPHTATVYDVGDVDGQLYLAMELVEGETLRQRAAGRPRPIAEILELGAQIADALAEAHRAGIVHRDLKPANVMVDARGRAKILDFGLARAAGGTAAGETVTEFATSPGLVLGTLLYMSPEQVQGRDVDGRSDIFSLGAVLYEMATGAPAFPGTAPTAVIDRIVNGQPDAIARFNYEAPAELERIIRKCLEKDPARRYQSAGELLVDLRNLQRDLTGSSPSGTVPVTRAPRRQRTRLALLAAAVVLLLASLAAVWLRNAAPEDRSAVQSVAVLPFTNMTDRPENEYLGDGLAEEVITHLARSGLLRVVARQSTFAFKGASVDVREIGRRLDVQTVLTGSIREAGSRLRVSAQLVNTADGYNLWSESFTRDAADLLALQDDISEAIAQRLIPAARGQAPSGSARTSNGEAYSQYLRGLHAMGPWDAEGLRRAEEYFGRALDLDPEFGAAWAALAEVTIMRHEMHQVRDREEAYARASDAARRAIAVRLPAAEGHAALAHVLLHQYNWAAAEEESKLAIEGNPGSAIGHAWYGLVLMSAGRLEEAEAVQRRTVALDPLSGQWRSYLARTLMALGRYEEAVVLSRQATDLPGLYGVEEEAVALAQLGRFDEARARLEAYSWPATRQGQPELLAAYVFAVQGRRDRAAEAIAGITPSTGVTPGLAPYVAMAYAALGDADRLFAGITPDDTTRVDQFVYFLQHLPEVRAFAGDPRLAALYAAANLRR